MRRVRMLGWLSLLIILSASPARAQSRYAGRLGGSSPGYAAHGGHGHGHIHGPPFGGGIVILPPVWLFPSYSPYGWYTPYGYPPSYGFGPMAPNLTFFSSPLPITGMGTVLRSADGSGNRAKHADPSYAAELITLGDRLFRAGNLSRAADRYEQAIKADPAKATARVRIVQVALSRGRFAEAAERLREAETVEPGWMTRAADIQSLYMEPGDFARQVSKLENHLQAQPNDRDAWLVLGAELFLSGRTRRAGDIFLRLSDRREDPTLAAFLDATRPRVVDR
jgi:tetratricopeptide (TPR) repeat protein